MRRQVWLVNTKRWLQGRTTVLRILNWEDWLLAREIFSIVLTKNEMLKNAVLLPRSGLAVQGRIFGCIQIWSVIMELTFTWGRIFILTGIWPCWMSVLLPLERMPCWDQIASFWHRCIRLIQWKEILVLNMGLPLRLVTTSGRAVV